MSACFAIEDVGEYKVIKLTGTLDYAGGKEFDEELARLTASPSHLIVNCDGITAFPKDWLRSLMCLHAALKKAEKSLVLVGVNNILLACLKREGADTAFKLAKDMREAMGEFGITAKKTLSTDFINPFLDAYISCICSIDRVFMIFKYLYVFS